MSIKICLDAGHYGKYNPSPVVAGYYESDMVWKLHLLQKKYLEAYGIQVITTRTSQGVDRDLYGRGAAAKGCNLFISDHSNACATESVDRPVAIVTLNGKATALGRQLAAVVQSTMGVSAPQTYSKANSGGTDWYGVLRGAAAVGVGGIILEHSFHTNRAAASWLMDDKNLDKLAKAEADCIAAYYGLGQATTPPSEESLAESESLLAVDGSWGPATTRETQRFLDSVVDAVISGQPADNKKYLYAASTTTWEFIPEGPCVGSDMVQRLQHFIGATEDRFFGPQSVERFQIWLRGKGYYTGAIDRSMGPETVRAWQRYLNEH